MTERLREKIKNILKKDLDDVKVRSAIIDLIDPWEEARGLLKNKDIDPVKEQNRLRDEFERYYK